MSASAVFPSNTGIEPVDRDAECAVLAAMLLDGEAARRALEEMDGRMFYEESHRLLFQAMGGLVQRGDVIDPVTLRDELLQRGELEGAGGMEYIGELIDVVPAAANINSYIRIIRQRAAERAVVRQAQTVIASVGDRVRFETAAAALPDLVRAVQTDGIAPFPEVRGWPDPPAAAAYYGLAGEVVAAIAPRSEADPVAILGHLLVGFGNIIGRGPYYRVEADEHRANLFALFIGRTSKGRKGVAWGHAQRLLAPVDPAWASRRLKAGLSTGEGLIWAVRDAITRRDPVKERGRVTDYETVLVDEGESDKRLLVAETEFASTLRVMGRDGNTLSATVRQSWDTGTLRTLTKNSPAQATGAHISIIGHVTADELRRYLDRTEVANGFLNRFLLLCVKRAQYLPEGGAPSDDALVPLADALRAAVEDAGAAGELVREAGARALWADVYPALSEGPPGLLGAVTSRAEAQVLRLSVVYALLDRSRVVRVPHLKAALALWAYATASARFVFGDTLGDPMADELYRAIRAKPEGLSRTEIRDLFGRHRSATETAGALERLAAQGLIERHERSTGGRTAERWRAATEATEAHADDPWSLPSLRSPPEPLNGGTGGATVHDPDEEARRGMRVGV